MLKKRILFVVADFYQGGAERYAYEIDKAISKDTYAITILCINLQENPNKNWTRYYDTKHLALGTSVFYIDPFLRKKNAFLENRIFKKLGLSKKKSIYDWEKLIPFLDSYDIIHWMGEYTFLHDIPEMLYSKSIVNSMSAKFQNQAIYNKFNFNYPYKFISGFTGNEFDYEFSDFREIKHWFFPLILEIKDRNNTWKFQNKAVKKIGIFTRLDKYKPLDPFFYAFHVLLDKYPNCELHIFGNGDPEKEGFTYFLKNLALQDKVFFRGHQKDIVETIHKESLDLSWFQGYNNDRPAGYAGFDVCSTGTPLLCWDFFDFPKPMVNEIYPHFKNINQFVAKSIQILSEEQVATDLSNKQFRDILENREALKIIKNLEAIYEEALLLQQNS